MQAQSVSYFFTVPKDEIVEKAHLTRVKKRKRACFEIPSGQFFSFFSASVALSLSLSTRFALVSHLTTPSQVDLVKFMTALC